jgi:hypothetical protein
MRRERVLKVVLVIVGLLFTAAVYPLILMVKQDPALAMMMSLYATLGIFLLVASRNLGAPQPHRLCGVVEPCPRRANVVPSIAQHDRSQRTDRVGCVRGDRHSAGRSGSGKEVSGASLCCDGASRQLTTKTP